MADPPGPHHRRCFCGRQPVSPEDLRAPDFGRGALSEIDGTPVPRTIFKSQSQVMAKGSGLKAMVPKGVTVHVEVVSPDGTTSAPFSFLR